MNTGKTTENYYTIYDTTILYTYTIILYSPLQRWWGTGTGCPEKLWIPLPGSVQGQVGWGFEQPGLVEGVRVHGRAVGTRW